MKLAVGSIVEHPKFGEGAIIAVEDGFYHIYFREHGKKELSQDFDGFDVLEEGVETDSSIGLEDVVVAVENVFEQYMDKSQAINLGDKWEGGVMILNPEDPTLKGKEIPIDTFFHKIVMLRDRLRVLEQNINSNKKLSDEDKVNLQQYITRCYGSLTTFNVLFDSREDWFIGDSSKG